MTYGTMQTRIADELVRDDLTSQIQNAIQTAIKHYRNTRFYFNEGRWTATTSADVAYYPYPADGIVLDTFKVTVNNNTYPLIREDWSTLDNFDVTDYTGYPQFFAVYANQVRLYPTPNDEFPMEIAGVKELSDLSASDDTNAWMTEAEEMIRCRAKADLYLNVLHESNRADEMATLVEVAKDSLDTRTAQNTHARLRPSRF